MSVAELVLTRTLHYMDPHKPRRPEREAIAGHLVVGRKIFHTVERNTTPWLRQGYYHVMMDYKNKKRTVGRDRDGNPIKVAVRCFRPLDCPFSTILIHDAAGDNHLTLDGCIAPGIERNTETGSVRWSDAAMQDIFNELGGFEDGDISGRILILEVTNNWPGIEGTRETYWPYRAPVHNRRHDATCPVAPPLPLLPDRVPDAPDELLMHEMPQPGALED